MIQPGFPLTEDRNQLPMIQTLIFNKWANSSQVPHFFHRNQQGFGASQAVHHIASVISLNYVPGATQANWMLEIGVTGKFFE